LGQVKSLKYEQIMKLSTTPILLTGLLLASCSNDPYRGFYEGIKSQSDGYRTPTERAVNPPTSYDAYKRERENLKQNEPDTAKEETPDFNLK